MAEAIVSAILPVILEKLASPLIKKFISSSSVEKDLDKLHTTFLSIQDVVEDAEEQQQRNRRMKSWLGKLKEVAYDIDDIFDELTIEDLRSHVEIGNDSVNKVCNNFSTPSNPFAFHYQMGCKIGEVVDRLDLIAKERPALNLSERTVDRLSQSGENRETHSFVHEAEVYGRNDDREKLVQLLINMGSEKKGTEDLSIVPIVGMGGLGKTTLAQLIYNDERVTSHFDKKMWAFVSKDFELVDILRAAISSATEDKCDLTFLDSLGKRLQSILSGRKYLLVLDDVWNEDVDKWGDFLKILLKCGDRGSKVIVTTRSEIVASVVGTLRTYFLEPLPEDDCWSLFKKRTFPKGDEHAFPKLLTIGKEILKRCGGLPLAVGALGGLLHYKRREEEWLVIKESDIWKVDGDKVISVLRLCYDHLSSPLKQCFAYCSFFPKGYAFERFKLIQLWIAEGFIQTSNGSRLAEDIGEEYFDMLCLRSLFQKVEKIKHEVLELELLCSNMVGAYCPYYHNMVQFRMHDLVCDLARSVAGTECSIIEGSECSINKSFRARGVRAQPHHLSYICKEALLLSINPSFVSIAKKQRTFILFGNTWGLSNFSSDILNLSYLRVLDLSSSGIFELPKSIGELQHLRLLDMSDTLISKLPKSVDTLWLLQTLRLLNCLQLKELPKGMSKMVNLRHLEIDGFQKMEHVPSGLGQLSCLQTLPLFIVGKERGCGIEELKSLNLRGRLVIKSLQNVLNPADAKRADLKEKQYISNLHLSWDDNNDDSITGGNENYQHVIESLEPHPNIEKLEIENFMGLNFPTWLISQRLPKLIAIGLKKFRCNSLPSFSEFSFLKVLSIEDIPNLELWSSWPRWSGWSSLERVQVLELVIIGCPKLTSLPNLPSLKKLRFERSNVTLFKFIFDFHSLVSLNIGDFPELTSLPQELQYLTLSEQAFEKAVVSHGTEIVRFTQKNLLRIYPKGTRFDSSNYNPLLGWMHGGQMVAFNMQGYGRSLWLMHGFFRANGGCGYVKKPDFLMKIGPHNEVFDPAKSHQVKKTLKVKVYMGDGWRLDFHHTHFDTYSPPDFYARVGIAGVTDDTIMKKTKTIEDDWAPVWNEEFTFPLSVPELALLRIEVHEYDMSEKDDFGGQTCLPVWELRSGIRSVPLFDRKGEKFKSVKLLMRFEFV